MSDVDISRGHAAGGMRDVLRIALPLVIASAGHAIRLASDRIMLSDVSTESLAASMPAGLGSFVIMSFFMGMAGYANTFVAQYTGAKRSERVGLAVWQAIYLSLAGGVLVALTAFFAVPIFRIFGHDVVTQALEVDYYTILAVFGWVPLVTAALNSFWSGRGKTKMVIVIELSSAFMNVFLNWVMIFGHFGCPAMGIQGAAYATGLSGLCGLFIARRYFLRPANRQEFGTLPAKTFDWDLFKRLIRFGAPTGLQFFLDLAAFQVFVVLMGCYGKVYGGAISIVFSLNAVAFIPLSGLGIATGVMVGQAIGEKSIPVAWKAVRSAFFLSVIYNVIMGVLFIFFPDWCLAPFFHETTPESLQILDVSKTALLYVSAYLVFDGLVMIYSNAVRGAGDTFWCLIVGIMMSWLLFAVPTYFIFTWGGTFWHLWTLLVACVMIQGFVYYFRFRGGKWQHMTVIEDVPDMPGEFDAMLLDYERG